MQIIIDDLNKTFRVFGVLLVLAVHERNNLIDVVLVVMNLTTKVFQQLSVSV